LKQELEATIRLVEVHKQLMEVNMQHVNELAVAISNCDSQWDAELSKIEKLGSTTLLNTRAASRRLRDLRQRREQLGLEIAAAQRELMRVQRVIELLDERTSSLTLAGESERRDEMLENWVGAKSAS
jgi:hypothetical protein